MIFTSPTDLKVGQKVQLLTLQQAEELVEQDILAKDSEGDFIPKSFLASPGSHLPLELIRVFGGALFSYLGNPSEHGIPITGYKFSLIDEEKFPTLLAELQCMADTLLFEPWMFDTRRVLSFNNFLDLMRKTEAVILRWDGGGPNLLHELRVVLTDDGQVDGYSMAGDVGSVFIAPDRGIAQDEDGVLHIEKLKTNTAHMTLTPLARILP